jgi:transposase
MTGERVTRDNCACSLCGNTHRDATGTGEPTTVERHHRTGRVCQCDVCGNRHRDGVRALTAPGYVSAAGEVSGG